MMRNTKLAGAIFSVLFLSATAINAAPKPKGVNVTIPVNPVPGVAVVDGNSSEWNLETDLAARMCTAGSIGEDGNCEGNGKENLSNLYARYDCNKNIMYVLVLREGNHSPDKSADNAWVRIDGKKVVDGSSGDFAWVEVDEELLGYEASFTLNAGTYSSQVHLNVSGDTSSTGKNGDSIEITVPETCNMPDEPTSKACDYIYGVHDKGLSDSQLLRYSAAGGLEPLGPLLANHDIEALDVSLDQQLYGASGSDTNKPGHLYTIDMDNGDILSEKPTGCNELDGISFNPSDGSLWGWSQDKGLVQIIDGTCSTVVSNPGGFEVEDLTWNNAGDTLYFAYNDHDGADPDAGSDANAAHHIGKYSVGSPVDWNVCNDIQAPEIEALEVLSDDTLIVGYHDNRRQFIAQVDLETCETNSGEETVYTDIEGIAACLPEVATCPSIVGTWSLGVDHNCDGRPDIMSTNTYNEDLTWDINGWSNGGSWSQEGCDITMADEIMNPAVIWTGTMGENGSLSGTYGNTKFSGCWTATRTGGTSDGIASANNPIQGTGNQFYGQ
ncbi:hypothetical protein [Candidatus Parabeggiatoa sp. HSG14]|uniref:hypothetical protein n=1 Tax=Candidatus Parabeggiatoa sp. HSG14 TaxID=3055593 RepID=UPI0025A87514|nr:hypothetical protein [Thiotrichales bacterium HSG14]